MMNNIFFLFFFLSVSGVAQHTSDTEYSKVQELQLTYEEPIYLKDVVLKVDRVVDSRCPRNVECVWAGEVSVGILIYKNGILQRDQEIHLKPGEVDQKFIFQTKGQKLLLVSVEPYPETATKKLKLKDYIFNVILKSEQT